MVACVSPSRLEGVMGEAGTRSSRSPSIIHSHPHVRDSLPVSKASRREMGRQLLQISGLHPESERVGTEVLLCKAGERKRGLEGLQLSSQ